MKLEINVNVRRYCAEADDILDAIEELGEQHGQTERKIMAALDNLRREVEEQRTITQSAISLIEGLKTRLDEAIASNDMEEVQRLADELDAQQTSLAAAITANTPTAGTEGGNLGGPGNATPGVPVAPEDGAADEGSRPD